MKRRFISLVLLSALFTSASAQSATDLIRLTQTYPSGSARSMAMGGAFGALGADLASPSLNPAGLGLYRKGELSFTSMLSTHKTETDLMGSTGSDNRYSFDFNNIGMVIPIEDFRNRTLFTVGFGANRLADFNQDLCWSTPHAASSMLDEFTAAANNGGDPLLPDALSRYSSMAFNVFAMDTCYFYGIDPATGRYADDPYFHDMLNVYGQYMARSITRRGGITETFFSLGFNVNDVLYLGGTLDAQEVRFLEKVTHHESTWDENAYMQNFRMVDRFSTEGWGAGFKLGAIVRPIPEVRFGLAWHSPTWYTLESTSFLSMDTHFRRSPASTGDLDFYDENENVFEYHMRTPGRFLASWACVIPSAGILSVDYEYTDYSHARMKAKHDKAYADGVTEDARQQYHGAGTLRIGGEVLLTANMSLRAGYASQGNPARKGYLNGGQKNQQFISAGFGYRGEDAFIDFSWQHALQDQDIWFYNDLNGSAVNAGTKAVTNRVAVTLGLRL